MISWFRQPKANTIAKLQRQDLNLDTVLDGLHEVNSFAAYQLAYIGIIWLFQVY